MGTQQSDSNTKETTNHTYDHTYNSPTDHSILPIPNMHDLCHIQQMKYYNTSDIFITISENMKTNIFNIITWKITQNAPNDLQFTILNNLEFNPHHTDKKIKQQTTYHICLHPTLPRFYTVPTNHITLTEEKSDTNIQKWIPQLRVYSIHDFNNCLLTFPICSFPIAADCMKWYSICQNEELMMYSGRDNALEIFIKIYHLSYNNNKCEEYTIYFDSNYKIIDCGIINNDYKNISVLTRIGNKQLIFYNIRNFKTKMKIWSFDIDVIFLGRPWFSFSNKWEFFVMCGHHNDLGRHYKHSTHIFNTLNGKRIQYSEWDTYKEPSLSFKWFEWKYNHYLNITYGSWKAGTRIYGKKIEFLRVDERENVCEILLQFFDDIKGIVDIILKMIVTHGEVINDSLFKFVTSEPINVIEKYNACVYQETITKDSNDRWDRLKITGYEVRIHCFE
eukprot:102545_1